MESKKDSRENNDLMSDDEESVNASAVNQNDLDDNTIVNDVIDNDNNQNEPVDWLHAISRSSKNKRIAALKYYLTCYESSGNDSDIMLIKTILKIEDIKIDPFNYREVLRSMTDVINTAKDETNELSPIAFNFLLGFLYTNFTLLWPPIRDAISSCLVDNRHRRPDFMRTVINKLQLIPNESVSREDGEKVDHNSYKINILKILEACSDLSQQYNRLLIAYFFQLYDSMSAMKDAHVDVDSDVGPVKIESVNWTLLEGYLRIFSAFKNFLSVFRSSDLRIVFHTLLKNPRPNLQEYSLKCLCNYNDTTLSAYKDQLLQIIDEKTFKAALISFNVAATAEEDRSLPDKHRPVVMPILLSILSGKLKYKTPQRKVKSASQAKKPIILRFIGACKVEEIMCFLGNILEPLSHLILVPIDEAISTVEKTFESVKFHTLESSLKTLTLSLEYFGNISPMLTSYLSRGLIVIAAYVNSTLDCCERRKAAVAHGEVKSACEDIHCTTASSSSAPIPPTAAEVASKRIIHSINRYKELRSSCIKLSITLFKDLRDRVLPAREIHSLFTHLIVPSLCSVKSSDLSTVPQILSLLVVFSEDSRFFPLLDYRITPESLSPFDTIVRSLDQVKEPSHGGLDAVLTIVSNLLTLDEVAHGHADDDDDDDETGERSLGCISLCVPCSTAGIDLVKPHASTILACYKRLLTTITTSTRRFSTKRLGTARGNIKPRDLQILKHFGTLVTCEDDCYTLASLLIQILRVTHTSQAPQHTEYFIDAISKLTEVCHTSSALLLPLLAPLFYSLRENRYRSTLAQLVSEISSHIPSKETGEHYAPLVNGLVSIHKVIPGLTEEPDYGAKFQGFKSISQYFPHVKRGDVSFTIAQMIAYSCCHTLLYDRDPGVTRAVIDLIESIATQTETDDLIFNKICINIFLMRGVKCALRSCEDTVRAVAIDALRVLMKNNSSRHPVLRDLATLCDETDIEVDFWSNVQHIQRHRRARAFLRLTNNCSLLASMRKEVVWNFLLPLAEANLQKQQKHLASSSSSSSSRSLEKASIELIGVLSRFFTWKQYKTCLRKYLTAFTDGSLTLSVDVVSRILTNFPFDLTEAKYEKCNLKLIHEKERKEGQKSVQLEARPECGNADINLPRRATTSTSKCTSKSTLALSSSSSTTTTTSTSPSSSVAQCHVARQKVTPEEATVIFNEIKSILLYDICCKIFEMAYVDHDADRMKSTFDEREQVQRIPLAIAVVKLLIQFPPDSGLLDTHLNGILLRLLHFLKCKSESMRKVARKALQTITLDLGPRYLPFIIRELKNSLTKGFQRHILSFTVHFLLFSMKDHITSHSLDASTMYTLFDICVDDLLGTVSEEKQVGKIISKTMEARKPKANEILHLMGLYCPSHVIDKLFAKFSELLTTASTYRVLKKISLALDSWINGLTGNTTLSVECLLALSHKIMQDYSLPVQQGSEKTQGELVEKRLNGQSRRKVDSLVIDPASVNNRKASKQHAHNQHTVLLIEKATSLLLTLLESGRVHGRNSLIPLVDLCVPSLTEHLSSKHVKLVSCTLRVLLHLNRNLPTLASLVAKSPLITSRLFVLMSQHSGFKSNEGTTEHLTDLCFKSMAALVTRSEVTISPDQLAVLLSHVDADLDDGAGRPASFTLLKAIAHRRLEAPEMHELMKKVSHMAIQSEDDRTRKRCVTTWITYLASYLRGKILQEHLLFIVRQLDYSRESGRLSALTVLAAAVRALPASTLKSNQPVLVLPLACRLINEDSSKCKELAFRVMKSLLRNVGSSERDHIFTSLVLPCMHQTDIRQKSLATFLTTLLLQIEKDYFTANRWPIVSPVLAHYLCTVAVKEEKKRERKRKHIEQENAVEQDEEEEEEGKKEEEQKKQDDVKEEGESEQKEREVALLLFQQLSLVLEVMKAGVSAKWIRCEPGLQSILGAVEECYLRYAHSWVRLISARVLGHLFSLYAPQELAEKTVASLSTLLSSSNTRDAAHDEFLLREPENRLPLLTRGFVLLLYSSSDLQPALGEQLVMNLAFVARVLVLTARSFTPPLFPSLCPPHLTMSWFLKQILKPASLERARNAHCIRIRLLVLKLMALIILEFQRDELQPLLPIILPTLVRECAPSPTLSDDDRDNLSSIAQQVLQITRTLVGADTFNTLWNQVRNEMRVKKLARKQMQAQKRVIAPASDAVTRLNKRKRQCEKKRENKRKRT